MRFNIQARSLQDLFHQMIRRIKDALVFIHAPLASLTVLGNLPGQHLPKQVPTLGVAFNGPLRFQEQRGEAIEGRQQRAALELSEVTR